jgi:anti-sigma factor RsiW
MNACPERWETLTALADGELAPAERALAEEHLASCAACRAALQRLRALKAAVAQGEARAPLPPALEHRIERPPRRRRRWPWATAAAALAAAALVVLWPATPLVDLLAEDHLRYASARAPWQFELAAPDDAPARFAGRLPFAFRAPSLRGAALRGGRFCTLAGHPAAMLFYERAGRRPSLFAFDNERLGKSLGDACDLSARGLSICVRREKGIAYALVSDLPDPEMRAVLEGAFVHGP